MLVFQQQNKKVTAVSSYYFQCNNAGLKLKIKNNFPCSKLLFSMQAFCPVFWLCVSESEQAICNEFPYPFHL